MEEAKVDKCEDAERLVEEDDLLVSAFGQFNTAAAQLRRSYTMLQDEVNNLNLELESKNRELGHSLGEQEKVNNYLDNILKSLNVGVMVIEPHGRITTFNRTAESLMGFAGEEVLGENLGCLGGSEPGRKVIELMKKRGSGGYADTEIFTSSPKPSHLAVSITPLNNKRSGADGSVVIVEDITSLRKLEKQAQRTSRFTAMGEMAAKLAHEIRNPLCSIELCASSLKKELVEMGADVALMDHLLNGVKSVNNAVSNTLLFTKSPQPFEEEFDLIETVEETFRLAHYLLKKNKVKLTKIYQTDTMEIHSDRELLKQLLFNLILNAVQAMPHGGELTVSALPFENRISSRKDSRILYRSMPVCDGNWIEIKIEDTGPGIPDEIREMIFDPFFTTKEEGTGLGLAIVHNIAEQLLGAVELERGAGQGAAFSVILPIDPREHTQ